MKADSCPTCNFPLEIGDVIIYCSECGEPMCSACQIDGVCEKCLDGFGADEIEEVFEWSV